MTYYKLVFWVCDKENCQEVNRREIPEGHILVDDICNRCHQAIHEPITSVIVSQKKEKRREET